MCGGGGGTGGEAGEEDEELEGVEVEELEVDDNQERFVSSPLKCRSDG